MTNPRHDFRNAIGYPVFPDRTERACIHCGVVKVIMTPSGKRGWREWRTSTRTIWKAESPPPCVVRDVGEVAAS